MDRDVLDIDLNRLLAQVISSLTASLRHSGALRVGVAEFQSNVMPYLHTSVLSSCAPPPCGEGLQYTVFGGRDHQVCLSACLLDSHVRSTTEIKLRDVVPQGGSAAKTMIKTKRTIQCLDWSPTGLECGFNYQTPSVVFGRDLVNCLEPCA